LATAFGIYNDYYTQYITLVYGEYTEPTWEEALKNYSPKFEAAWKKLNWLLGNKDYMCGGLTWVDFALTDAIQLLNQLNPAILSQFPLLTDYQKRVWNLQ
jgi:glutathione S-transferase